MKRLLIFTIALGLIFFSAVDAYAQEGLVADFVLPPDSSVEVTSSGEVSRLVNTHNEYQQHFSLHDQEVFVDSDLFGARIAMNDFFVYFRPYAKAYVREQFELQQGSIWVKVLKGGQPFGMKLGPLDITSEEGEFLVYTSPDHSDVAIKVLSGSARVDHTVLLQEIDLDAERMTRFDTLGFLIAPVPIEPSLITKWWEFEDFDEIRQLPVADAGEDQYTVESATVQLNGLNSSFEDGYIFDWTLEEGPVSELVFDTEDITRPSFDPPQPGVYTFSLVVVNPDGLKSEPDMVRIFVGENYLSTAQVFDDVSKDHKYSLGVQYLYKHGVVNGYFDQATEKRFFYPDSPVTRSQVLKVFFLGSRKDVPEISSEADAGFVDVDSSEWYAKYVRYAKDEGIIGGHPDGTYKPDQPVNRAAALKISLSINGIDVSSLEDEGELYSDVDSDAWYASFMRFAKANDLFDTDSSGNVYPDKDMSRAEVSELMYRLIKGGFVGYRGKLTGFVVESDGVTPLPEYEVRVYTTQSTSLAASSVDGEEDVKYERDSLLLTLDTKEDGSFQSFLPSGFYSISAAVDNKEASQQFLVEVRNQSASSVMIEIDE